MNHLQFFAAIKQGEVQSCYLMEGEEEYIKQQALRRLEDKLLPPALADMNLTELKNPDADTLIAACDTLPLMAERRVVVVRELDLLSSGKKSEDDTKQERIVGYLEHICPETCLVFYMKGKADARKKLYLWLKKHAVIVDFSQMTESECVPWAVKAMQQQAKSMTQDVAQQLVLTVGKDASLLRQEMDKLCAYVGERAEITRDDIEQICVHSTEYTVFQMVDAQVAGQMDRALRLLSALLREGQDNLGVLALLLRQYRLMYHMRAMMEDKTPQSEWASLLAIPPFAVGRTLSQAKRFPLFKLRQAYELLFSIEYEIKTGRLSQDGAAQQAMLRVRALLA